jgi:diguanylate cyclase
MRHSVEGFDWDRHAAGMRVTISAGIAAWRRGEAAEQILKRADEALYDAKKSGRNRVCVSPA